MTDLLPVKTTGAPALLTRRSILAGTGAAALGGAALALSGGQHAEAAETIRQRLDRSIHSLCDGHAAGVSVKDMRTGSVYRYRSTWENNCASIVKPFAVMMAIKAARKKGRWLTTYEQSLASKAIIYSDNNACTELWNRGGKHAGLDALAEQLGLTHTHAWYGWGWGRTWTSAGDYRYFMNQLLVGMNGFTSKDRSYLLNLMSRTIKSQSWGVGAVRSSTVRVEMKDGWVVLSNDNLWRVNSVGHVKGNGRDYILTILTGKNRTMDAGVSRCNAVSKSVYSLLGQGRLNNT